MCLWCCCSFCFHRTKKPCHYVSAMHSSSVFLFAASLSSAEQLWSPLHTLSSKSHLSDGSWILLDFLLPMKLEGALFISFLLHCEMGFTPANMNLTLTFDSTVTWLSPLWGCPEPQIRHLLYKSHFTSPSGYLHWPSSSELLKDLLLVAISVPVLKLPEVLSHCFSSFPNKVLTFLGQRHASPFSTPHQHLSLVFVITGYW